MRYRNSAKNDAEIVNAATCARERRAPEQSERERRLPDPQFDHDEAGKAGSCAGELGEDRGAAPALGVAAQEREHEEQQATAQRQLSGQVDPVRLGVARLAQPREGCGEPERSER